MEAGTAVGDTVALAEAVEVGINNAADFSHVGTHALIDFWGVDVAKLTDLKSVEAALRAAAKAASATVLSANLHQFGGHHGLTGVLLLAESHLSIHTWPENGFAALDVYLCGSGQIEPCIAALRLAFCPTSESIQRTVRGTRP